MGVVGFLSSHSSAVAQALPTVRWVGPSSCPRPPTLADDVARRAEAEGIDASAFEVSVEVTELTDEYELTLRVERGDERAVRTVVLPSCAELTRAAALLIHTALAPAAEASESTAPSEPMASEQPAAQAPPVSPFALRVAGVADWQALPGLSGGPALGVGFAFPRVLAWGEARYLFGREFRDLEQAARARVDLFAFGLGSAFVWRFGGFALGPSVELELGALRSRALGSRAAGSAFAPWVQAALGGVAQQRLGPVELGLLALFGVPLLRPEFVLGAADNSYQTAAYSLRLELFVAFALGSKKGARAGQ